ncbi:hypothetical protein LZ32DRAFT_652783 [Colletotrichum eremochloae]|nr:hypothetical protein LZ32DRAFT_652783 [Colletotrichum eremochloae]
MKGGAAAAIGGIAALAQVVETTYVWPSKYDEIEDILSLQTGYRSRGFVEGVPEPDMQLDTTRSTFAKAGVRRNEMITLLACGNTLGGVHSRNSPHITDLDPTPDTVAKFDGMFDDFDNRIATDSDKRVFASDGNRTTQDLGRTRGGFKTACADVFTRMIDTVPSAVQLTEPIEAVDIKPYVGLVLSGNGSITFSGLVRVRTTGGTWRDTNDLAVHLSFTDRNGEGSVTVPATLDEGGETFVWYRFETAVPAASGIRAFCVQLTTL